MVDRKLVVLAIDDNQDNLVIVRAYVNESFPHSFIYTAQSGKEGLLIASQVNPDVILLDINMPDMDGFDVCKALRNDPRYEDTPIMFLTAVKADKENRIKALEVGGDAFLSKPIDMSELKAQIRVMWKIRISNLEKRNENTRLNFLVNEKTEQLINAHNELLITFKTLREENERRKISENELELARNKYGSILNDLPALICEFKTDGTLIYNNETYSSYFPRSLSTNSKQIPIKRSWKDSLILNAEQPTRTFIEQTQLNNQDCWIEWRERAIFNTSGELVSLYAIGVDNTERYINRKNIEKLLNQLQSMFNGHNAVMLLINPRNGMIIDSNPAASKFYGYTQQELLGMGIKEICMLGSDEQKLQCTDAFSVGSKHTTAQHRLKDGSFRMVDIYSSQINYSGELMTYAIIFDVSDREEAMEEIRYLSFHDHLTSLYNRRFFEAEMNRLDVARNWPITLIMGDVNGLKLINDSFGHQEGDDFLKYTADILRASCRGDDIIARIGGDEFAILLPKTSEEETDRLLFRIKSKIQEAVKSKPLLSISFGYATKKENSSLLKDKMVEAENMMYNNKMYESTSMRNKSVKLIMNALFEKSARELNHSNRVSTICEQIATAMNLSQDEINRVKLAGLVHDIGKIGVDEKILNKPGKLDADEWLEIKKHPEAGWRILNSTDEFSEVSRLILCHHECWNGSGYPNQLKNVEIPIESRIISVADAYDAMTNVRTYNQRIPKEQAIEELKRSSGTQFDPDIVDIIITKVLNFQNL
jgi:diguanylate cyclase (GGDEF)-like protein/PAS domain S-box-containing protein